MPACCIYWLPGSGCSGLLPPGNCTLRQCGLTLHVRLLSQQSVSRIQNILSRREKTFRRKTSKKPHGVSTNSVYKFCRQRTARKPCCATESVGCRCKIRYISKFTAASRGCPWDSTAVQLLPIWLNVWIAWLGWVFAVFHIDSVIGYIGMLLSCLSVCMSVTLCIVAKWYILLQKSLNKWIGIGSVSK